MGAFEAVISLGLAISYIIAGPVLDAVTPQGVYLIGGVTALAASVVLVPLRNLRPVAEDESIPPPTVPGAAVVGEPVAVAVERSS